MTEKRKEFLEQLSQTNNEPDENKVFAAMSLSGSARAKLAKAQKLVDDSKESLR